MFQSLLFTYLNPDSDFFGQAYIYAYYHTFRFLRFFDE